MLRSVCFLLLLLFSLSSSHDGKQLVLAEEELQDGSSLDCGGEPSCYRKGNPYKSDASTVGNEIQTSRVLLLPDLNRAASRGVLFPSISYSQSRTLPSTIILSPAQNMLNNPKLASSANSSASVVESPSVFSGKLQNKGSNWPLLWTINTPQFCSLSPPSLAVQPSVHPPTHKHFFSKLVLDHGTHNYCAPPVFLQGINSRSLIRRAHVHNVPPFRSSHQEADHNDAPYFFISPRSLTTEKMKHIEAASSAYDSVRSGPSLPPTQDRRSQESLRFGKYTRSVFPSYTLPVFAPSLLPMHYGQPQDPPSQSVQAPENQPSVRFLPPSNGWPLQALPPIASDGEPARGPFVNENQPSKALPPMLASLGPPMVTSPPLLSPHAEQYRMHPSAFHPVMPNPSNHTKWLSRVFGTPSQIQPPVEHSRTSVSPSGPVASPPRILPSETPRKESNMPVRALPKTRSRRQAPIAAPYNNQEPFSSPPASIPSQPLPRNPRTPELAPSIKFVSPPYQQGLRGSVSSPHASLPFESPSGNAGIPAFTPPFKGTISSPTSLPSEPPEAAPLIISPSHVHHHNIRAWPKNISKAQAPVALAPKIQGHVITPIRQHSRSPMEYPGRPESAPSIAFNPPQYRRDENVQGPVASSPSIFPSVPHQKKPSIPVAAQPRNRSKMQKPVALAPKNQEPVTPISLPSKSPVEYLGTPEGAPLIGFHSPPRNQNVKGTISSPTSFPSEPPEAAPSIISPSHVHHHNMRAWPKNISKAQAPVALAPKIQGHVIPPMRQHSRSPMEHPGRPESAPSMAFNPPQYHRDENVQGPVASSPSIFPSVPRQKKPSIPVAAQPRNRSKRQKPVALAPKNQEPVTPISLPSKSPVEYPGTPEGAPLIRFHSPPRNQNVKGPTSPPRISPSISHRQKSIIPVENQTRKGSWRHSPSINATIIQGPVSSPLITPPPEQPNFRTIFAPSIVFQSPSHYPRVKGHLTPPGNAPSEPPQKKPRTPVAPPPTIRSWLHPPPAIPPTSQGPSSPPHAFPPEHYRRHSGVPPFPPSITFPSPPYHQRMEVPIAAPTSIASSKAPEKTPNVPLEAPASKRSWSHAPTAIPPINQGPVSSPIIIPFESPRGNTRRPAPAPSRISPTTHHYWGMKGPVASTPTMFPSAPAQKKPSIQMAPPPIKRSSEHAPVASPLMAEGPVYSPVNRPLPSPSGNLRPPAVSPSIQFRSPPHHRHVKGPSASSAPAPSRISPTHHFWGMKGPVASTPRMIPSAPPPKKPSIPMEAPASKSSSKYAPVASPTMGEGPSASAPAPSRISPTPHHYWGMKGPVASTPRMIPSAPPKTEPSIPMAAPPSKSLLKHASVASPTMGEGPVASTTRMIPSAPPKTEPSIPMAAPPSKSSLKHASVASPTMGEVNRPLLSPSGNLRPPAVSPSIGFHSPPHHRHPKGNLSPPAVSPSIMFPSPPNHRHVKGPSASPANIAPSESPKMTQRIPLVPPPLVFPPPPPSQDCSPISCTEPLTSTPPGAPCGCVLPMKVELELDVALYAFFPLVSELAAEIAAGTFLKQSQVRIMGANADTQDQEKTIVILDLVPLGQKFDNTTAFLIFERFWQKKVIINGTLFGDYWVILVSYPGLPPPPPSAFSNINGEPINSSGPSKHEPLGVDINKRSKKMGAGIIAVVALSSAIGAVICVGAVWITLLKCKNRSRPTSVVVEPTLGSSVVKRSGGCGGSILSGSMASSTSMSFASSMAPLTGSAKTITIAELERATDRFSSQNILGEGGFGRVYRGVLEDGTKVAVKVLTRDDQQGGREFIAEVEMLSRLHHRNLVKLIGICTEEHNRSLVYELIPNGSVESHLHGLDKERAPLDWDARIKIALGAARGLAYLHEDSSPRVIHRDFKASNILLEDDFTPKVSDFGLAKSASEEVSGHISTRVMGTFGYVAPEYAMTGHLLVKSDVYSYGVVLLELLTGRKPVDMSQPPGQENLVTWARPLLTSKEGLEALVDPALGSNLPFDNIARVAAIASMCVQPEVSHRPFMGEVVQALKLVCSDSDTSNGGGSGHFSLGGESNAHYTEVKDGSSQQWPQSIQYVPDGSSFVTIDYDSGPLQTQGLETERPLSASALLSTSGSLMRQFSGSFRRHSSSGPLRTNKSKKSWYGIRGLAGGSISEHGVTRHEDVHELWP